MADVKTNGNGHAHHEEEEDWEYEDEEAEDYEWEYESEEEEEPEVANKQEEQQPEVAADEEEEEDLPDPFAVTSPKVALATPNGHHDGEEKKKKHRGETDEERKHKKHHKKSKQHDDEYRNKKIHVRSKDPSRIARQFEKGLSSTKSKGKGKVAPPPMKVNQNCPNCGKEPYLVERIVAEKAWWHKNCFRCKVCNKSLNLDTYMSHEGVLYCKPHHRELFQPKVVFRENEKDPVSTKTQEAVERHRMQELRMETIVRENRPVDLGDKVIKSGANDKYAGLEDLDVGSKFRMFERTSESPERRPQASDRFGIMEKLKRLQEGEDLDDLLAEINEELPSEEEDQDLDPNLTNVQRRTQNAEKLFSEDGKERRQKLADERKKELKSLRQKIMAGTKDTLMDQFDDLLNASANKVKKTQVDVRSENAKKFREMFDKGQVPEATGKETDKATMEKEAELEMMRKVKKQQRDFFKKMESGQLEEKKKEPKEQLLVRKLKDITADENIDDDMLEMAPLANRFSFFEKLKDGEKPKKHSKDSNDPVETDVARKECKARSVLNKFKELEAKALNGEPDDVDRPKRPNLKRFTPPRKLAGEGSDSESDYSDSDYSYSSSYTSSNYSDESDVEDVDETLKAIRAAQRARELRAKFEEWEQTQDAKDQLQQITIFDENGECLDTANNLRAKFEALQMHDAARATAQEAQKFRIKRFK